MQCRWLKIAGLAGAACVLLVLAFRYERLARLENAFRMVIIGALCRMMQYCGGIY